MVSSEQRRKQLAREKFQRQQERRAQARRKARIRNSLIALALATVLAAGGAYAASGGLNGGEDSDDSAVDASPAPSDSAVSDAPDPCGKPSAGKPNGKQWKKEPKMAVDTSAAYTMTLSTTCGEIGVALDAGKAPHTVNSFAFLAGEKFFDHTACHRLTTSEMGVLQCGDPTGQGAGGPGYTIPDENLGDPRIKNQTYPAGTVAMANTGQKNTGGSQFFLVYKDSPLPPQYTPFGKVTGGGMEVLKKIAEAGVRGGGPDGAPNATVVIDKATVGKS